MMRIPDAPAPKKEKKNKNKKRKASSGSSVDSDEDITLPGGIGSLALIIHGPVKT